MQTIEERLAKSKARTAQLEQQIREKEKREKDAKRNEDLRRKTTVGELFIKHFPIVMSLTPHYDKDKKDAEFAPLNNFLASLAANERVLALLKKRLRKSDKGKN